jgi:4-hydroxy-tetrahydrodipicolinate synthase
MTEFRGVIPPLATPLLAPDQLDPQAVGRLIEHVLHGGAAGLFVLGTTGEGPSLTYQMRYEMVEVACDANAGRVPVLVGVTDTSLAESLALAGHAEACGADAIVAAAPFYFDVPQSALVEWFRELADRSPLPLMLYNMPSCVGTVLDLTTVAALAGHPNVVGIKDSGGDLNYFAALCEQYAGRRDFVVFMGPEERLAEAVALGAAGGVCGGANFLPQVYCGLYDAASRRDNAAVRRWQSLVGQLFDQVYRDETGQLRVIPALKFALAECGLCEAILAPPLQEVSAAHGGQIRQAVPRLLDLIENPTVGAVHSPG